MTATRWLIASGLLCFLGLVPLFAQVQFTDVSAAAGITHSIAGEGVCIFDYDNDGWEDILVLNLNGANLLYRNLGNLAFQEVAGSAGLAHPGQNRSAAAADIDNDGDLDVAIGVVNDSCRLFLNNGDGTFTDITGTAGLQAAQDVRGIAWCDIDQDGWVDLYVTNLQTPNAFYRNNGDLTFIDVTTALNAAGPVSPGLVMSAGFFDYDGDGDEDLFMPQDGQLGNVLLRMESSGVFTDVSAAAGVVVPVQGMGVAIGDYNRDGWPDVYTTNLDENTLFRNRGDGTFEDVTQAAGVGDAPLSMGWGTFFFDADNDGWPDIYNNNQTGFGQVPNSFFRNRHDGTFADLSVASGLASTNDGIGAAFADLDNDGDLDIFLAGHPSPAGSLILFRNDSQNNHHWIQFLLRGVTANRSAVGAVVRLYTSDGVQMSFVAAGNGYASQNTLRQHFGLGSIGAIDSVVVSWPGGRRENFGAPAVDRQQVLVEGQGTTGLPSSDDVLPQGFVLEQNYPNPFNPQTIIRYRLPDRVEVELAVFDLSGKRVAVLVQGMQSAGWHSVRWQPQGVDSGVYFYRLRVGSHTITRKALYLR
ncbi:MAG: T9SS C-terminal target domain-containing protein [Calditrichaeota bacterium]|nr:MAG: T9SS C-terminal target domain-containing protein [Calditrichota bacterium]